MKRKPSLIPLLGLGLVIGLNVYFRSFPMNFPQLADEAAARVESRLRYRSAELINRNYASMSDMAREPLVKAAMQEYRKQNKPGILADTFEEYNRMKDRFQDQNGQTYLFELDCWHWARYVENTVLKGHPGDVVVNGEQRDLLMNHPLGEKVSYNMLLFYVSAFMYKTALLFVQVPLYTFLFYLPLFFAAVFLAALYVICWRFYGAFAAFICSLFVGLAPIFLPRSCAGWFDMDILNLLFPLLVVFSYLMAYGRGKLRTRLFWVGLSSLLVGLFAYTWVYWWFVVVVIVLYELYTLLDLVAERLQYKTIIHSAMRRHFISLAIFLPLCAVAVLALCGPDPLAILWKQVINAVTLNDPIDASIWPNVLSTVGELSRPSFKQIANFVGSEFLFVIALFSMLALVLRNKRYRGPKRESIFLFVIWFIIIFTICYKGTRLIVFLLVPMGIFLGWGAREAYNYCKRRRKKKKYLIPVMWVLIAALVGSFIFNGQRVAKGLYPMIDDSWYILLNNIKQHTPPNAVLNSWWDFGDWFKAIAGRRVIFDGQSQNTPQGYWMAKVFLSESEESAMAILRMLNNGGNRAFEMIDSHIKDPYLSLSLLERALGARPYAAKKILSDNLPEDIASAVRSMLFDKPAPAYFIVDYTLIGKMYPISYLGNWDAARLYVVKHMNKNSKGSVIDKLAALGIGKDAAAALYDEARLLLPGEYNRWISHNARFLSGEIAGKIQGDMVLFDKGLVYDTRERKVFVFNGYDGKYHVPKSLFYEKDGRLTEHVYDDSTLEYSVMLLEDKQGYRMVKFDRELGMSLFARLYFLKGKGLRHFKPYTDNNDPRNYVGVFEIDWNGNE